MKTFQSHFYARQLNALLYRPKNNILWWISFFFSFISFAYLLEKKEKTKTC